MRTLSIGLDLPYVTESVRWTDDYNLKDYQVTFANLCDIESADNVMTPESTAPLSVQFPNHEDVLQYCKHGNDLFVLLPSEREVDLQHIRNGEHQGTRPVDLLRWLPFEIRLKANSGESVAPASVGEKWSWYFNEPFKREYIIYRIGQDTDESDSTGQVFQDMLIRAQPSSIPLAESISGDSIAAAVDLTPFQDKILRQQDGNPGNWDGRVYLLPVEETSAAPTIINGVLRYIFNKDVSNAEDTPNWVSDVTLEYEREIEERLQRERQLLGEIRHFKQLWWASGNRLEGCVFDAFQRLGVSVSDTQEDGLWDGVLHYDGTKYVVEVTGTEGAVGVDKTRQLQDWVHQVAEEKQAEDVIGLLIANPHRTANPDNRGDPVTESGVNHLYRNENMFLETSDLLGCILAYLRGDEQPGDINHTLFTELARISVNEDRE